MMNDKRITQKGEQDLGIGPVVSASHLAAGAMPELSEIEFALNISTNAFQRWIVRGTSATGIEGLTAMDVLVLHSINHRGRTKSLADLCLVLNIEDTYLVNYAIKKLKNVGLINVGRRGKEKTVSINTKGEEACASYHKIREALLVKSVLALGLDPDEVSKAATLLRALSGHYEQAARSAASL